MISHAQAPAEQSTDSIFRSVPWSPIGFGLLMLVGLLIAWHPAPPTRLELSDEEWRGRIKDIEKILDPLWESPNQRTNELLALNHELGPEEFLHRVGKQQYRAVPANLARQVWDGLEELGLGDSVWIKTVKRYGIVPADSSVYGFVAYMFLHAGFLHMFLGLVFLIPLGLFYERYWEPGFPALVFLGGGLLGGVVHWITDSASLTPAVGAAGAIGAWVAAMLPYLYETRRCEILPPTGGLPGIPALPFVLAWPVVSFLCWRLASGAEVVPLNVWGQMVASFFGVVAGATIRTSEYERKLVGVHRSLVGVADRPAAKPGRMPRTADAEVPQQAHLRDDWLSEKPAEASADGGAAVPAGPISAEEEARQALEAHDWSTAHHWLLQVLEAQPQNVEALEGMLRACLALTRDEEAYNAGQRLMTILIKDGRREKALVVYDRLFSKFSRHSLDPTSLSQLARFFENAARYERAIELYAQVARSKGAEALIQKAMLRFGQLCAYRTNDLHRADQALRFLLQTYPATPLRNEVMDVLEHLQKAAATPKKGEAPRPGVMADLDEDA